MPDYVPYNTVDECEGCQRLLPVRILENRLCSNCEREVLSYDYDAAVRDLEHQENEAVEDADDVGGSNHE